MKTNNIQHSKNYPSKLGFSLCGAISLYTIVIASLELVIPSQSVQASPELAIASKQKQAKPPVVKIAGTYKTVVTPEFWVEAKKEGVKSLSGNWTIQPNGAFEAFLSLTFTNGEVQNIRTAGKISIVNGKVISQIETVDGVKPEEIPPSQSYTLLQDGKTLQADGQPVQLVKQ